MHIFCIHDMDIWYNIDDKCIDLVGQLLECVCAHNYLITYLLNLMLKVVGISLTGANMQCCILQAQNNTNFI